jgi:thymidylate synthase (FAD)
MTIGMEILTQPRVYLVGRTQIDQTAVQQFLQDEGVEWTTDGDTGPELLCELAGRVCYMSFGAKQGRRSNREYLANIVTQEHGSVLEHVVWNFIITGVSRSFTHELVRHRVGTGFSQLSQRYVDGSETDVVVPPMLLEAQAANPERGARIMDLWKDLTGQTVAAYKEISDLLADHLKETYPDMKPRDRRIKGREAARSVLPNAVESKIFFSANARALRHIIEYRGDSFAEAEIRRLAVMLLRIMQKEAPVLFGDYTVVRLPDGSEAVLTDHKKV